MQPTKIGGVGLATPASAPSLQPAPSGAGTAVVVVPASFPVKLTAEEISTVSKRLDGADIVVIPLRDIATLGSECETELSRVLDGFLANIDEFDNPQIYKLFDALTEKVGENNLPALANRIINNDPSFWERVKLMFTSAKGRKQAAAHAWEQLQRTVSGRTKTLTDLVHEKERELGDEQQKLNAEIDVLEQLKDSYRTSFRDFAATVAFMETFLERARADVAAAKAKADPNDPAQKAEIDALEDKLAALESRTLALRGGLTRLPADQIMIRQLENAGVQTLQETSTTAVARFNSIKSTLLQLNGSMLIKGVQRAAEAGAVLDEQLAEVQGALAKEVVTKAANAAGDNRIRQAEMIKQIVADTKAIETIVQEGRKNNAGKFQIARSTLENAQKDLLAIGQRVRPGTALQR